MRKMRRHPWRYALALIVLAVLLAACAGGGAPSEMPTAFGFLPVPTLTPAPAVTPYSIHERSDLCPGFSRAACLLPGDQVNVYEALSLERAAALWVYRDSVQRWVLDSELMQQVLSLLDREVVLVPRTLSTTFWMSIEWRQGEGTPHYPSSEVPIDLEVDENAGLINLPMGGRNVQWAMPEGFVDLLLASLSDITPTPFPSTPRPTRAPSPTVAPTIVPPQAVFFDHPEGVLAWDGPDDRVSTRGRAHCEPSEEIREDFGVPALVEVEDEVRFWFQRVLPRETGWRWTGYYHGDWQIWQGDEPRTSYLLHAREERIAFEYRSFGCS